MSVSGCLTINYVSSLIVSTMLYNTATVSSQSTKECKNSKHGIVQCLTIIGYVSI